MRGLERVDVELVGPVELARVAVAGAEEQQHPWPRRASPRRAARPGVSWSGPCTAWGWCSAAAPPPPAPCRPARRRRVALLGVQGEHADAVGDELRGGLVPARDQEQAEADDLLVGERGPVDLRLHQRAEDVVGRALPARHRELVGQHRDLHRSLRGRGWRHRVAGLAREEVVGPLPGVVVTVGGDAEHGADDRRRQQRGELVHHVELVTPVESVEQRARPLAHARFELGDAARREPARDQLAHLRVLGWVELDHRLDRSIGVLDRDALGGRVRAGVVQPAQDVVEARQRPEVHALVVVQRRVVAQPRVRGVRVAMESVVERVELHHAPPFDVSERQTRFAPISARSTSCVLAS